MKFTTLSSIALPLVLVTAFLTGSRERPAKPQEIKGEVKAGTKGGDGGKPAADANAAIIQFQKPCYPLTKCAVSGEPLPKDAVDTVIDGRLVRVCCKDCVAGAEKNKAAIFAEIDKAVIQSQRLGYPLKTCPMSGESLEDGAVEFVVGTRLMKACCEKCVAAVKAEPEKAIKQLNDAYVAAQKPNYPLTTCVATGEEIGKDPEMKPIDFLYGTRYYRLCCAGCKKAIVKDPEGMWAKVEAARAAKK
ncbi:MAG: hypothetical protein FJ294_09065 [Planctomycetes bacterium]|nr:hypothetical protein [Planctomycetota bacterium]